MVEQPQAIKSGADLAKLRGRLGLTQTEMAEGLGLTPRPYQDIEAGRTKVRLMLSLAAELISMRMAIGRGDPSLASAVIRKEAKMLVEMLER